MAVMVRTAARAYDDAGRHTGPGEWLTVIRTSNGIEPGIFGSPNHVGPWWAGGSVEEYDDARVLRDGDETVRVVSTTDRGERVLRAAAERLGIQVSTVTTT